MKALPKKKRVTDRAYVKWVKQHTCLVQYHYQSGVANCKGPIDPHHVVPVSLHGSDHTVVPLCRKHHDEANRRDVFEAQYGLDLDADIRKLRELYRREYTSLHRPIRERETRQMLVSFTVRHCICGGDHKLAFSKITIGKKEITFRCPVKNAEMAARLK